MSIRFAASYKEISFFFSLGLFVATLIFLGWFFLREKPLDYKYIAGPLPSRMVSVSQSGNNTQFSENGSLPICSGPQTVNTVNLININTASADILDTLPGIGSARAKTIIDSRPYSKVEDLIIKKVIPRSVFDQIKDKVGVG